MITNQDPTRIARILAYALAIFTEYTAWAAFGECQEVLWRFAFLLQICKWGIEYAHLVMTGTQGFTYTHYYHTKFLHCSPYRTLDICLFCY